MIIHTYLVRVFESDFYGHSISGENGKRLRLHKTTHTNHTVIIRIILRQNTFVGLKNFSG